MAFHHQINCSGRAPVPPRAPAQHPQTVWMPSPGVYLTDETTLFRVADIHSHGRETLLELEDCATLDIILHPARLLDRLKLRTITPASN